jgi:inhibitor of KinA
VLGLTRVLRGSLAVESRTFSRPEETTGLSDCQPFAECTVVEDLSLVSFHAAGDAAVLAQFGTEIDPQLSRRVFQLYERVVARKIAGVTGCIPAFATLFVQFDPLVTSAADIVPELARLVSDLQDGHGPTGARWRIPVCYDLSVAPDLEEICTTVKLSVTEFVRLHTSRSYLVYMLGGFPGYPFLGDVPDAIRVPRRTAPRLRVEPGTVALAGQLSAIYPTPTPGGWNLIGRTPIPIFDAAADQPALFAPGDSVTFVPVGIEEFETLARAATQGEISRGQLLAEAP